MGKVRSIEEYVQWILDLERKLPVEQWTIDDVHVWPLLRTSLTFYYFNSGTGRKSGAPQRYIGLKSLARNSWALLKFLVTPIGNVPVIGADFAAYRATVDGKLMDKYFDPIFDSYEGHHRGLIVEYQLEEDVSNKDYYKPERILRLYEFRQVLQLIGLAKAKFSSPDYKLEGFEEFLRILESEGINIAHFQKEITRKKIAIIKGLKWFWKRLYKKTNAKVAIGLCYYTEPLYAMILAARESGVVSVDLQHGGQGKLHLPYAQYLKLPAGGFYDVLPHYFWCWDDPSASVIQQWITDLHSVHKVIQKGHPWLDYNRSRKWPSLDEAKDLVLITLQSYDLSALIKPIDDYLAETIRLTAHEVKWFIRLHPRMLPFWNELKDQLRELGVLDIVDIDNANSLPMPAILSRASIHMTKSSGSAIEAAMLGVPNIVLDEHGASRYEEYIRQGQATLYTEHNSKGLADLIRSMVSGKKITPPVSSGNWNFIFELQ